MLINADTDDTRIRSNASVGGQGSGNSGISTAGADGLIIDGNVSSRGNWGVYINNLGVQLDPATIRNNAMVGPSGSGYYFGNPGNANPAYSVRFDNNVGVSAGASGAVLDFKASISSAQGNNLHGNGLHGFRNQTPGAVLLKKTYFGLVGGAQGPGYSGPNGNFDPASTEATKPKGFKARKAAKLM